MTALTHLYKDYFLRPCAFLYLGLYLCNLQTHFFFFFFPYFFNTTATVNCVPMKCISQYNVFSPCWAPMKPDTSSYLTSAKSGLASLVRLQSWAHIQMLFCVQGCIVCLFFFFRSPLSCFIAALPRRKFKRMRKNNGSYYFIQPTQSSVPKAFSIRKSKGRSRREKWWANEAMTWLSFLFLRWR